MCLLFDMQQSHMKIFARWHEAGWYGRVCWLTSCKAVAGEVLPKLYKREKTTWTSQLGSFSVYSFGRDATTEYHRLEWVKWQKCIIPVLEARHSRSKWQQGWLLLRAVKNFLTILGILYLVCITPVSAFVFTQWSPQRSCVQVAIFIRAPVILE